MTILRDVYKIFGLIPPHRICNLDEIGLTTAQAPAPVAVPKDIKQIDKYISN